MLYDVFEMLWRVAEFYVWDVWYNFVYSACVPVVIFLGALRPPMISIQPVINFPEPYQYMLLLCGVESIDVLQHWLYNDTILVRIIWKQN